MFFNQFYDRICSYIILPFRLFMYVNLTLILSGGLFMNNKLSLDYSENIIDGVFNFVPWVLGVKIKIIKDKNYESFIKDRRNYILVFNHVSFYDIFMIRCLLLKKISGLIIEYMYNTSIIHEIFKEFKMIPVERGKKCNSIEKIKRYIENDGSICIAPDGCDTFNEKEINIAPFKNGAFIPKKDIYPLLIRYIPSYTKNVNWGENDSFINAFINNFTDGNIECILKVLPKQHYKEEYKSHEDYREFIYNLMRDELYKLPDQFPPRILKSEEISLLENIILYLLFGLACIDNYYIKLFMVNYMSYSYKTKNTLNMALFMNILTAYSCFFRS